jgi:peptidoglycan/xylan/chitin deacetylase (PgdA/CDA1 family)
VDPQDWRRPGISVVTSRILNSARNGSIILAHDIHSPTIKAMPGTLDGLLKKGFRFVTVSQLIQMEQQTSFASLSSFGPGAL